MPYIGGALFVIVFVEDFFSLLFVQEAQDAKSAGFHLNQDMNEFNLPTSLWVHGKEKPPNETVFNLSEIEGEDWFDERLRKSCQVF